VSKYIPLFTVFIVVAVTIAVFVVQKDHSAKPETFFTSPSPTPHTVLQTPPTKKVLQNDYHIFQTFNNCGPAALSMALSYYDIDVTQEELGLALRPYQVHNGDNDDKSVTLTELAKKAEDYGFVPFHRPNGTIELMKQFVTYNIPVIARTYLRENEDIGHYRVVKGFDQSTQELIQDDSLQGKNLRYSYDTFNALWKKFSFEYLVLVPKDKKEIAEAILKEDTDLKTSWQKAVVNATAQLQENPDDIHARFNLSVAYYNNEEYQKAVEEYEKVENKLSFRTLWYQIEPIKAYFELGNYQKVFAITDTILHNQNRAFSELYIIRAEIYKKQGDIPMAKEELEKAILYNNQLKAPKDLLEALQ